MQKLRNRVDYLSKEDQRVEKKIEKMQKAVMAREKILVQKWQDEIKITETQSETQLKSEAKKFSIKSSVTR